LIEQAIIVIFVRVADVIGVPKSVGEIYGLLYGSASPLAFQDIADRLEMSKGSVSQGMRLLRSTGAVRLVYAAGDRRDLFEPETELRALLTGFLREKIQPHLEDGTRRIEALRDLARTSDLGADTEARVLRGRIDKLGAWQKRGKAIIPFVSKFLI